MAIRDKEKENRPRGLRMPSLSAIKFKKSHQQSPPDSPPTELPPEISLYPAYPARTDSVPVRPPRPHEKELPPNPLPSPPPFPAASVSSPSGYRNPGPPLPPLPPQNHGQDPDQDLSVSPRGLSPAASPPSLNTATFASNAHLNFSSSSPPSQTGFSPSSPPNRSDFSPKSPTNRAEFSPVKRVPSIPRVPVPNSEHPPLPVQRPTPPSSINHDIDEPPRRQSSAAEQPQQQHQRPQEEEDDDDPLENFIPDPETDREHPHEHDNEPDLDGPGSAIEEASSEENNGPWTPPDFEPVAAPLNKLHYVCYQDHRAMPPAANRWHALPCMTCQKFDREVRHRCVFCCLRVCVGCYQTLQKTPNRSLGLLMNSLGETRDS